MQYNKINLSVFIDRLRAAMDDRINTFMHLALQNIQNGKYENLLSAQQWAQLYSEWSHDGASEIDIEIMKYLSH